MVGVISLAISVTGYTLSGESDGTVTLAPWILAEFSPTAFN